MNAHKIVLYLIITLLGLSVFLNYKYETRTLLLSNKIRGFLSSSTDSTKSLKADIRIDNVYLLRRGWANTIKKLHIDSEVVFFGDSHTYFADFQQYFPNVSICNLGLEGDNMEHFPKRLDMLQYVHPDKVFFMGG